VPEDRGRLVTAFLTNFFRRYVEYNFTADLEQKLDLVSDGKLDWKVLLRDFWSPFVETVDETKNLKFAEVISALDQDLSPHLFQQVEGGTDPRACPACADGRLSLKLGKFGAFVGCSNYPACQYTRGAARTEPICSSGRPRRPPPLPRRRNPSPRRRRQRAKPRRQRPRPRRSPSAYRCPRACSPPTST
jgi:hypothetical protein